MLLIDCNICITGFDCDTGIREYKGHKYCRVEQIETTQGAMVSICMHLLNSVLCSHFSDEED